MSLAAASLLDDHVWGAKHNKACKLLVEYTLQAVSGPPLRPAGTASQQTAVCSPSRAQLLLPSISSFQTETRRKSDASAHELDRVLMRNCFVVSAKNLALVAVAIGP